MPSAEFKRAIEVTSPPDECWRVLTDVQTVAGWVAVVGDVKEIDHLRSYQAVLQDQFGPFKLRADLAVSVTDVDENRSIRFTAKGTDRQVGTTITVDAHLAIAPGGDRTTIEAEGRWTVLGSVATMGSGTIRKKADTIVDEFFAAASRALGA